MTTAVATPDAPRNSRELRSAISDLESHLSEYAQAGNSDGYRDIHASLLATKSELDIAERRELAEAAEQHRLKQDRRMAGMDSDGSLASAGFATPGDAIAAHLRAGRVSTANVEHLVREALSKTQNRR